MCWSTRARWWPEAEAPLTIELRKPAPWSVREITRTIDKMPLRQQEIRAGE